MEPSDVILKRRRAWWVAVAATAVVALAAWQIFARTSPGAHDVGRAEVRGTPINSTATKSVAADATPATAGVPAAAASSTDQDGTKRISFDLLTNYVHPRPILRHDDVETPAPAKPAGDPVPKEIRALSGKKVSIAGYMLPIDYSEEECTEFVLSGCPPGCCFGSAMRPNGWISVTMSEGKKARAIGSPRFVRVEGILDVKGLPADDEEGTPVFSITADVVNEADGLR